MNKLIIEIGKLLHGEQFVSALANDLDINRKTIQRYISEEVAVNPNLYPEILNLLKQHQKKANHLIEKVEAYCNEHKYAIKIFNQGEFKVERDYLKKLVEDGKKVILDTDFYTYRNNSIFNKNKKPPIFFSRLCGGQPFGPVATKTTGFLSRLCGGQPARILGR